MVETVTLQDTPLASAGNPNFLGSFSGGIRAIGNAFEEQAKLGGVVARFKQAEITASLKLAQSGGNSLKAFKAAEIELLTTFKSLVGGATSREIAQMSPIMQGFGGVGGTGGHFVSGEIRKEEALEQEQAEARANILVNYASGYQNDSEEEKDRRVGLVQDKFANLNTMTKELEELKAKTDLPRAEKLREQESIFYKNVSGNALLLQGDLNNIIGELEENETEEGRKIARQALNELQTSTLNDIRRDFPEMVTSGALEAHLKLMEDTFILAEERISNADTALSYKNRSIILQEMAMQDVILNNKEALKAFTVLTTVAKFSEALNWEEKSIFSINVNRFLSLVGMTAAIPDPDEDDGGSEGFTLSGILQALGRTEPEAVKESSQAARDFATMLKNPELLRAAAEDPEVSKVLNKMGQLITNKMAISPNTVPAETYDALLSISATPGGIDDLTKQPGGEKVLSNLQSGMRSYMDTLTESLINNLGKQINERIATSFFKPLTPARKPTEIKIPGTDIVILSISHDSLVPDEILSREFFRPKKGDLVTISINQSNGNFEFSPRVGLENNPSARIVVRDLNKMYSRRLGELTRSHAHLNRGDEKYREAAADLITFDPRLNTLFSIDFKGRVTLKETPETALGQKLSAEFEKKVEELVPLDIDRVRALMDEGNREEAVRLLKESGIDAEQAEKISGLRIPALSQVDEGSLLQLEDGTVAIVKQGKLVEPTAEDLQLG